MWGQSFSVKIFDRSRSGCQVIRLVAGDDFCGPSGQAFPLPSSESLPLARRFFLASTTSKRLLRRLVSLGPGSTVVEKGKKRGKMGKISASEASRAVSWGEGKGGGASRHAFDAVVP